MFTTKALSPWPHHPSTACPCERLHQCVLLGMDRPQMDDRQGHGAQWDRLNVSKGTWYVLGWKHSEIYFPEVIFLLRWSWISASFLILLNVANVSFTSSLLCSDLSFSIINAPLLPLFPPPVKMFILPFYDRSSPPCIRNSHRRGLLRRLCSPLTWLSLSSWIPSSLSESLAENFAVIQAKMQVT